MESVRIYSCDKQKQPQVVRKQGHVTLSSVFPFSVMVIPRPQMILKNNMYSSVTVQSVPAVSQLNP